MKNRILLTVVSIMLLVTTLTSCGLWGRVGDKGDVTVVVENTDGGYDVYEVYLEEVENKSEGAKGILEHLNQGKDKLYLKMTDSTYGAYVSAIGSIEESFADKKYVMVYTSVEAESYDGAPTVEYEGTTLYQSGVGLSTMSVSEGTIILFRLEVSPY